MPTGDMTPFQKAVDAAEALPEEDRHALVELIERRLIESRRAEIAENARLTLQSIREGTAGYGSVEDLRKDLKG